jgi:hypothetical protein
MMLVIAGQKARSVVFMSNVPAIHPLRKKMDARDKPGHDEKRD